MAITRPELQLYRPTIVDDTAANGGRITANEIIPSTSQNLFPDAGVTERAAGSDKFRKVFYKTNAASDEELKNVVVYLEFITPGDDRSYIFVGDQQNTQGDLTGSEDLFGVGTLDSDVSGGATSIDVLVEDGATAIFRNSEFIRISEKADLDAAGNAEIVQIHPSNAITVLADVVTVPLATGLVNGYAAATPTHVSSLIQAGDLLPNFDNFLVTSVGSGAYDEITNPLTLSNRATVEQLWTLTFTGATNYDVVGDIIGSVGSGSTAGDFSPNNPDWALPFFTLLSAGFSGVFTAGDTIVWETHPGAAPVWHERVIPPGAGSISGNSIFAVFDGEATP